MLEMERVRSVRPGCFVVRNALIICVSSRKGNCEGISVRVSWGQWRDLSPRRSEVALTPMSRVLQTLPGTQSEVGEVLFCNCEEVAVL